MNINNIAIQQKTINIDLNKILSTPNINPNSPLVLFVKYEIEFSRF